MAVVAVAHPKELMSQHLETLSDYAKISLQNNGSLTTAETNDRDERIRELFTMADVLGLTPRDVVWMLFRKILSKAASV